MFKAIWSQYFPPKPAFTETNVPPGSQVGKVFIITGANQGIGLELLKILYPTGATIYLAGRSQERVTKAIEQVASSAQPVPATPATLRYLHLDLSDLTTIKPAAAAFAGQEQRLDILWNNAGIGGNPKGTTTKQNIEGHVGTNCVAPLLFTQELLPQLQNASKSATPGSVRIVWTGSLMIETFSPKGGVDFLSIEAKATTDSNKDYAVSKAGNLFLSAEAADRWGKFGIVSVCQNPGNLLTNIYSHQSAALMAVLKLFLYEPKMGAHTMLHAGFSQDISLENNGAYVWPFGRTEPMTRQDIVDAIKAGKATSFWDWCEKKYAESV
jgi:NAD(P)-dependent dehydrogenase (short-subunit alcohol dehydrogenase family)